MGNAILAVVKEYVQFEDYPPQQQTKIVRKPVQITNHYRHRYHTICVALLAG